MSRCIACNSVLQVHEYQSRAADEAHTQVISCDNCPVDASKVMPLRPLRLPERYMYSKIPPRKRPSAYHNHASTGSRYVLSIEIPHSMGVPAPSDNHVASPRHIPSVFGGGTVDSEASDIISGPLSGLSVSNPERQHIGMGIYISCFRVYFVSTPGSECKEIRGKYTAYDHIQGYESWVYCGNGTNRSLIMVDMKSDVGDARLKRVVNDLYSRGALPQHPRQYVGEDIVARLSNLSPRAWDVAVAPQSMHMFTAKMDGERCWMVLHGKVWYQCRPRCAGDVSKWWWCDVTTDNSIGVVVVDCEYVASHGYYVIDFLTSATGVAAPVLRDLSWAYGEFAALQRRCGKLPFELRSYFDLASSAAAYAMSVLCPTDGLVAIRNTSTETLKVKDVKSIELKHAGGGNMISGEDEFIMTVPEATVFSVGSIIEFRITVDSNTHDMKVHDMFRRVDKLAANSKDAISNIVSSAMLLPSSDNSDRRTALLWCNSLRSEVHRRIRVMKSNRTIILDIGSGDGQSLDSIVFDEKLSYIFVEPDLKKCESLRRRIRSRPIVRDVSDLTSLIRGLKVRSLPHVVVNCKLSDITNNQELTQRLLGEIKCISATFSCHFVVDELHDIHATHGVPIFGCMYTYDSANGSTLVSSAGVTMTRQDRVAIVKWGRDNAYEEPVTYAADYAGLGKVLSGLELVPMSDMTARSAAALICQKVSVLLP